MSGKENEPQADEDHNIFEQDEEAQRDQTDDVIGEAFDKMQAEDDDEDDGGFDQPLEARQSDMPDVVNTEDGKQLLDDAEERDSKRKPQPDFEEDAEQNEAKDESKPEPESEEDGSRKAEPAEGDEEGKIEAEKADDKSDLFASGVDDLLKDVPDASRDQITKRLTEADNVLAPFKSRMSDLKQWGSSPKEAMDRLIQINDFASEKPDEYLAWAATQFKQDAPHELLNGAAEKLGYKLVKSDDSDDDLFEDEETKTLRQENERLKAQIEGRDPNAPNFGPDSPEYQARTKAQRDLENFTNERDPSTGNLVRPHFREVEDEIVAMAQRHVAATQKTVTPDDLSYFYKVAVEAKGLEQSGNSNAQDAAKQEGAGTSAAQGGGDMAKQLKDKAARASKARKASKSIDGSGQGANRRPALPEDASLDDVIDQNMRRLGF